jgi:hypothetical protein
MGSLSPWSGLCTPLYFIAGKSDSNVLSSQDNICRSHSSLSLPLTSQRAFINLMKVAGPPPPRLYVHLHTVGTWPPVAQKLISTRTATKIPKSSKQIHYHVTVHSISHEVLSRCVILPLFASHCHNTEISK